MALHFRLILLLLTISATFGKYVYVTVKSNWFNAQKTCRDLHTDLAPISSQYDTNLLRQLAGNNPPHIWFGLMRNTSNPSEWIWSGGGEVTIFFWDPTQPDNAATPLYFGLLINYMWHDAIFNFSSTPHFFCYKVHVKRERKTWEEALEYCRTNHCDLASVASETEMMLMQKEMNKEGFVTEHVWIGLRYLAGDWFWMDKQPLVYEAWGPGQMPWCPAEYCGALQVMGTKEQNPQNPASLNVVVQVEDIKVWNARRCSEKLYFLCY